MAHDHVLEKALGTVAEEWVKHRRFEHAESYRHGGKCECGVEMMWEDHRLHQQREMAMAVAAWARLAPMGTEDAVRHALEAERARVAAGEP